MGINQQKVTKPKFAVICYFIFLLLLQSSQITLQAQSGNDLNSIRIEELTDQQINQLINEMNKAGITDFQLEELAMQRGMSRESFIKLKMKIQTVKNSGQYYSNTNNYAEQGRKVITDSIQKLERKPLSNYDLIFSSLISKNYGSDIFSNKLTNFEPNLRIPTPKNYIIAADDEILIDVSGYSEANYKLKVSPEGSIRIPMVGPIYVSGLSIEQARKKISQKLASTIYTNIRSGKTSVDINLGSIRSIKIHVIGEATSPGTYTLPSLASAYNALYACGGPNTNGSFRNIQVIRNNNVISTIDLYDYLHSGSRKKDIRLNDEDVIKINTYEKRIELKGEVKKPGLYDVLKGETLSAILQFAGGYTDNAYTSRIQVFRNTHTEREVVTLTLDQLKYLEPSGGDTYIISKILNRFSNRVTINGAVFRPGEFQLKEGMTLSQLIKEADGLREDAYPGRAVIHRYKADLSPEIIAFDVKQIMNGGKQDIALKREDRIIIYSQFDIKQGRYVSIQGEIQNPGTFLFEEGMQLQDLILLSGGFKESATQNRIEISRRLKQNDSLANIKESKTAEIIKKDIAFNLTDSSIGNSILLEPFDEIVIRKAPGYSEQKNVVVEGEVAFTGKYTLQSKTDKISDIIKRAGGITPFAYVKGAVLVRTKNLTKTERYNNEQGLNNLIKQNYQAGASEAILQNQIAMATMKSSENIGIDLEKIIDNPGTVYDLLLNDGDTLRIPKLLQTVRVNGEVLYPTLVRYDEDFNFKDYINAAGGFNDRSARKRSYVVNANGAARATKSFLFFKNYPKIKPGAEIFVPVKREKERLKTLEIISITTSLATLAAILFNVIE